MTMSQMVLAERARHKHAQATTAAPTKHDDHNATGSFVVPSLHTGDEENATEEAQQVSAAAIAAGRAFAVAALAATGAGGGVSVHSGSGVVVGKGR